MELPSTRGTPHGFVNERRSANVGPQILAGGVARQSRARSISRIGIRSRKCQRRITLNNALSITPGSSDQQPGDDQNKGQFSVKTDAPSGSDLGDIQHTGHGPAGPGVMQNGFANKEYDCAWPSLLPADLPRRSPGQCDCVPRWRRTPLSVAATCETDAHGDAGRTARLL